jgi:Holliday junction DNA helicase RuvA
MIGKLTGIVDYLDSDHLLLDVNNVGYVIFCSSNLLYRLKNSDKLSLFIYSQTREDGTFLYGFEDLALKKQFLILLTVKGVGPKLALAILSEMGVEDISKAIFSQDKSKFQNISGVGLKLAERIIVELKGKNVQMKFNDSNILEIGQDICLDAVSALVNLGITKADAHAKVTKILATNPDITIDQLIATSLRR